MDSISEISLSPLSHSVLYADDVVLYRPILQLEDYSSVQSDIEAIVEWWSNHFLQLNPTKCKYMVLSRRSSQSVNAGSLYLGGFTLEQVEEFKYLGVLITNNLSWSKHSTGVCNKAKKILGLVYRQFYTSSSPETLKQLYLSLIRPHLEYAAQLWDPFMQKDISKLESVQKFALKMITHRWDLNYEDLLSIVNVPKLRERRRHLKLATMYKIIHELCYFPDHVFKLQSRYSSRLTRTDTIFQPFARTNYFYHSFVISSIVAWNSLSENQVCASNICSFKSSLQ